MSTLATDRTNLDTIQEHVDDHNEIHRLHNVFDGTAPTDFVHVVGAVPFRITKRVEALADAATVTPNIDSYDEGKLTTLSQTTTIANPTGTPTEGQTYILRIKSTTQRSLAFGSQYRGGVDIALPTATTGASKTDYFGVRYNSNDTKWDLIAKATGY